MSECEHEMIWVGSYTNLRCAKCNESYTTIQTEKVTQLEAELSECRAENAMLSRVSSIKHKAINELEAELTALRQAAVDAVRSWDGATTFVGENETKCRHIRADKFDNLRAALAKGEEHE